MSTQLNTKPFISKAHKVHGLKYAYSKAKYINAKTPLIIICKNHGEFKITPNNLSVLFSNLETLLAPLCLSLTKCLRRYLLIAIMLVSALEKKADRRIRIPIELKSIQRGISFNRR